MRVALYARFSSDQQNARSADDQLDHLRSVVKAKGWTEVIAYKDEAISGANLMTRPGLMTLMAEANKGSFDIVFAEALDRISRDQADTAQIFKTLQYLGIELHTSSEGLVNIVQAGEEEVAVSSAQATQLRSSVERSFHEVESRLERLLDLYEREIIGIDKLRERAVGMEAKRDALKAELAALETPRTYSIHPKAAEHYRRLVEALHATLVGDDAAAAREAFRGLLDHVTVIPAADASKAFELEIHGRLAAMLGTNKNTLSDFGGKGAVVMGAGTGFEPVTFRL